MDFRILSLLIITLLISACGQNDNLTKQGSKNDTTPAKTDNLKTDSLSRAHDKHHENTDITLSVSIMLAEMRKYVLTGNVDYNFLKLMISHHKASIDMSRIYVQISNNDKLKVAAEKIITDKTMEMSEMEKILLEFKAPESGQIDKSYKQNIDKIMKGLNDNMKFKVTGNADKDFASLMVLQHKDAIELSNSELQFGTDDNVKALAQKIMHKHELEIKELDSLATVER